eukprot:Skav221003  [mRNA]  locus=scaffold1846:62388:65025:+ [translate_table: standard]
MKARRDVEKCEIQLLVQGAVDHYGLLGVPRTCDAAEIQAAYRAARHVAQEQRRVYDGSLELSTEELPQRPPKGQLAAEAAVVPGSPWVRRVEPLGRGPSR